MRRPFYFWNPMKPLRTSSVDELAGACAALVGAREAGSAPVVAVSGIDGAGKGWLCDQLVAAPALAAARITVVRVDDWRTEPAERFAGPDWGRRFYERSYRWDEMRANALEPARRGADLVLFDGIFALTNERRGWFDLSVWVERSFETALSRALQRNQEGLSPEALRDEYERVYWPAQRLHMERDRPAEHADWVFENDR